MLTGMPMVPYKPAQEQLSGAEPGGVMSSAEEESFVNGIGSDPTELKQFPAT